MLLICTCGTNFSNGFVVNTNVLCFRISLFPMIYNCYFVIFCFFEFKLKLRQFNLVFKKKKCIFELRILHIVVTPNTYQITLKEMTTDRKFCVALAG